MPVIKLEIGRQGLTTDQKQQLIERLTDTAVEITHIPKQAFTIYINEYADENVGVGGVTLDKIRKG